MRSLNLTLSPAVLERAWKGARRDLKQYVKAELEEVERHAQRRGRGFGGFRPGEWPDAKVLRMMQVALDRGNRRVQAGLAVMLLELDGEIEREFAAVMAERRDKLGTELTSLHEIASRHPSKPYARLAADIAWAFKGYGRTDEAKPASVHPAALRQPGEQRKPDVLAAELTEAHLALVTSIARVRELAGQIELAQRVAREDATTSLEAALQAAARLRDCLAEAALSVTAVAAQPSANADQLAAVVAEAATALRALALPSGRSHLERLAQELKNGRIATRNTVRRNPLERIRSAAANEASEGLAKLDSELRAFPGPPDATPWLTWFWQIAEAGNEEALTISSHLDETWPSIHRFLTSVDSTNWSDESSIGVDQVAPPAASAASQGSKTHLSGTEQAASGMPDTEAGGHTDEARTETRQDATVPQAIPSASADDALSKTDLGGSGTSGSTGIDSGPVAAMESSGDVEPEPASSAEGAATAASSGAASHQAVTTASSAAGGAKPNVSNTSDLAAPVAGDRQEVLTTIPQPSQGPTDAPTKVELSIPSFDSFKRSHWIDQDSEVVTAPWLHEEFTTDAISTAIEHLSADKWATAILIVRGLDQLGTGHAPTTDDVERAFSLRSGRWPLPEEEEQDLAARARRLLAQTTFPENTRHRLFVTICLAARGALNLLTDEEVEQLTTFAGFSSRMSTFLQEWAHVARRFPDPFAALARQLQAAGPSPIDELRQAAAQAHAALKDRLKELHSAVSKKVQRTHCRAAWDEFLAEARPVFDAVLVSPLDGKTQTELARLRKRATTIFDRQEAKHQDRVVMDRAVDDLLAMASRAVRTASAASTASAVAVTNGGDAFPNSVTQLLSPERVQGLSSEEQWLLSLFRAAVQKRPSLPTRILDEQVIAQFPWLLSTWPADAGAITAADTSQCLDPLAATAFLLRVERLPLEISQVRQWLSEQAPWLLLHTSSLRDRERTAVEEFYRRHRDRIDTYLAALRGHHIDLAELADRHANRVYDVICAIEQFANGQYQDVLFVAGWAYFVLGTVADHVERTIRSVASDAEYSSGLERDEITELVKHRRFADLHSRGSRAKDAKDVGTAVRATPFRRDAEARWPAPKQALSLLAQEAGQPANLRGLIHDWGQASKNPASPLGADKQRSLREHFLEVVLDLTAQKRKKKVIPSKDAHRFSCADVVDWLPKSALTPTFLPQIRRYTDIFVKVLAVSSVDRSLPSKLLALGEEGSLTVVLAPGLSPQLREECRRGLQLSTGRPIAIFDDLDLCRMVNPGGVQPHLVEALVEVIAEQQRWNEFSPYEVQEGQHVRMEMYVGRRPEAALLVNGTTYSRIFSGRRLGKTALLRYVEHKYDGSPLASGKTLRVLYVPIVGLGSEREVVPEIVSKLETTVGVKFPSHTDPRVRLKAVIKAVLNHRPDESYLVFLDEADTFFENQTRSDVIDGTDHEASLSWVMRASEGEKDSRQLPRIRFVVCGYRATNRSEGAWGNWGDVLLLNPLEPADAVQLVTGPLARLGVDARSQADGIAFRCGYQPAVIVYFCTRLLAELERRTPFTERDKRIVRAEDVISVFQLPEVHDRVRETVWLNFVGDPLGQLTFAAFLAETANLTPGTPIEDAPQRILSHVRREADEGDLTHWIEGSWQDLGARHLRDLVKRSLLAEADHHPPSLRLRFPHQLPILLQESPQVRIRDALARLGAPRVASGQRSEWLVPDDVLENMRWALSDDAREIGVRAVVFGSHWTEPLLNRTGLMHRLPEDRLLGRIATAADIDAGGEHARALVGGADLLRAALQRQTDVGPSIEVARLGRCSADAIDGYFKRVRSVEFSSPGALQKILDATGGIPLLLERLSACFPDEATVDGAQLDSAVRNVGKAVPELVRELISGRSERRLDNRECELLVGVLAASSFMPDAIEDILTDDETLQEAVASLARKTPQVSTDKLRVPPLAAGDNERLVLLLNLGLLKRRPLGQVPSWALSEVAPIPESDVLRSFIPHILKAIAT